MARKTDHLVLEGFDYVKNLPCYEGNLNGRDFPILMSNDRVPESKLWVCTVSGRITKEDCDAVANEKMGKSLLHTHAVNSAYLLMGEPDAVTAEITLGHDKYTLKTPSAVFVPAGMPHSIRPLHAQEGLWGAVTKVHYGGKYEVQPALVSFDVQEDTRQYIVEGYRWSSELSAHKGSVGDKGYPIMLSTDFMPTSQTWICPAMVLRTPEICEAINSGKGAGATPHYHDNGDEMYLILGEENCVTLKILLDHEEHFVKPPAAVYMPLNITHALEGVHAEPGKYGGPCGLFFGERYNPIPIKN